MRHMILCFMLVGVLGTASFAQPKHRPANIQKPAPSATRAATANSVEGSFVFGKEAVKLSHAYACLVKSKLKKRAPDVVLLFMDRPISREFVDDVDASGYGRLSKLYKMSQEEMVRGLQVWIDAETHTNVFTIYRHIPFQSIGAEVKPVTFTQGLVQGSVSKKDTFFDDVFEFNVTFKVALRTDGWTGDFVTPTPTKRKSGKASGQLVTNGKATQLNHADCAH